MDTHESAYLAGFFDGDGCVGMYAPRFQTNAFVGSTNFAVLERFQNAFGGAITEDRKRTSYGKRTFWTWQANGPHAIAALKAMIPYLCVKKEQAELACSLPIFPRGTVHLPFGEIDRRAAVAARVRELKKVA